MLLGIDIGGTTINLGLVAGSKLVKKQSVLSFAPQASLEETLDYLFDRISGIITPEVTAIGVGVPTVVDVEKGIVYDATNIPSWKVVPLKDRLEERFGVKVSVNNDSNCFALGASAVLGNPSPLLVGITLGTGTGMGILADGKLLCGCNCGAGEVGMIPYRGRVFESFCSKQFFTERGWEPKDAGDAAAKGDAAALALYEEFGTHLGELLTVVMYAYDPGCIVLGGGVSYGAPFFKGTMMRTLGERFEFSHSLERLRVSFLPDGDIPIIGASLL